MSNVEYQANVPLTCFKKHKLTVNQLQLKSDQTLHQTVSS